MIFKAIARTWNEAIFAPQSPVPLAVYRIFWGLLVIAKLLLYRPDWLNWFGVHGWTTLETMHKLEPGTRINLFDWLPQNDTAVEAIFWIGLVTAVLVTIGLFTRWSILATDLILCSLDERNLYAINAGDSFLRIAGFFLIFAPASTALSIDRFLRVRRGKEPREVQPQVVWAQRLIQFTVCLLYFVTAWWKSTGSTWLDGTAIYYVHHLDQFRRFALPSWLDDPLWVKLQTWYGLGIEFALGLFLWVKELRYWLLLGGLLLHVMLEYSMNVPLFQFVLVSAYVLFVDPEDVKRVVRRIRAGTRVGREATASPRAAEIAE